jgi:16S rRNA (guanine1207-N2)-methyltransferase
MSIPKIKPSLASRVEGPLRPPKRGHYFDPEPQVGSRPRTVQLRFGGLDLQLQADRGVFGSRAVDLGTLTLLREGPPAPATGDVLDLGAGYGPIAIALAIRAPQARFWAVDVNERAVELTRANAASAGVANVTACRPDEVPADVRFAAIYSNPPVRIGKGPLHSLLVDWLSRLRPDGAAYLVVQRNLGADSLAAWLAEQGFAVSRIKSKKGYRILEVRPAA